MILQKSFEYADLLNKHFLLLSILKPVVVSNIVLETMIHFFRNFWWVQNNKKFKRIYLFKISIFCIII